MGGRTRGRARRWAAGGVLAAVSATVLAACSVPAPPGDAPLRYRDKVFTGVTVASDVVYGNAPDLTGTPVDLKADVYTPTGDTQTSRPAVIWVHGGAFAAGDKTQAPFVKLATQFAQRGYVALSINYRLMSTEKCAGVHPPPASCQAAAIDAQHDAQAAVRWLRAHAAQYGVDPDRIAIGGGSAGADVALLVGAHSEDPGTSGTPGESSNVGGVVSISGVLPAEGQALLGPGDAPTLWFIGTEDPLIPDENDVVANAGALYNAGVTSVVEVLAGAGHVPLGTDGPTIYTQSAYFLYFSLDLAHAAGQPPAAAAATAAMARRLQARASG